MKKKKMVPNNIAVTPHNYQDSRPSNMHNMHFDAMSAASSTSSVSSTSSMGYSGETPYSSNYSSYPVPVSAPTINGEPIRYNTPYTMNHAAPRRLTLSSYDDSYPSLRKNEPSATAAPVCESAATDEADVLQALLFMRMPRSSSSADTDAGSGNEENVHCASPNAPESAGMEPAIAVKVPSPAESSGSSDRGRGASCRKVSGGVRLPLSPTGASPGGKRIRTNM